jgi:phosphoglycolate phosphatase
LIATFLPETPFRLVIGATSGKPKKPDPAVALEIARRLDIDPTHFFFMGDTPIDMRTASLAGMFPLGVLWGFRTAEELIASGAKMLLREPTHVIPWLS